MLPVIDRRRLLKSAAGLVAYPLVSCVETGQQAAAQMQPNVILCMADDQGWGDVGYNGHPFLKTPNLDAMSVAGLRFDRFYSGAPVCSPTRGSALTGRHPYRYGIPTANAGHLKPQEITLAEMLKGLGYRTGHFGKWHLGTLTNETVDGRRGGRQPENYAPPWEHGFDVAFSSEVQMPTWNPMVDQAFDSKYWTGPETHETENLSGDDSQVILDRAISFIQDAVQSENSFLAVVWFHTPHSPVLAGPQYREMYSEFSTGEQHFYGCITAMDEQVGRLRSELRHLGIHENTMLWYCSDNGPEGRTMQSNNNRGSSGGLRGRKRSLFEGGIRVPAILEWPAKVEGGSCTSIPCSTSDYFPTVAEVVGHDIASESRPYDGISLLPLIEGGMQERSRPIAFQTPNRNEQAVISRLGSPDHALIDNRYKFLSYLDMERTADDMLFDLAVDPGERHNLVEDLREVAQSMKSELNSWDESCLRSAQGEDYPDG